MMWRVLMWYDNNILDYFHWKKLKARLVFKNETKIGKTSKL